MTITSSVVACLLISMGNTDLKSNSQLLINSEVATNKTIGLYSEANNKRYAELYEELDSFSTLQNNWDGYGGIKPSLEIINTAKNFIDIIKKNKVMYPKLMVSGKGNISLFWKAQKNYIEIEFDTNNHLSFFYRLDNDVYGEDDVMISGDIPNKLSYSLQYLENRTSSKKAKYAISYTGDVNKTVNSLINMT